MKKIGFYFLFFFTFFIYAEELAVVLAGTVQGALGGPNWSPGHAITRMNFVKEDIYEFIGVFPKGGYEYKVAVGGNWDENYGENGTHNGSNIHLNVPDHDYQVRFVFNYKTKIVQDSINNPIKPYATPQIIEVIGLDLEKKEMQPIGNDIYQLKTRVAKGQYIYRVQYNQSEKEIYGRKAILQGEGIALDLEKDRAVVFTLNLANNIIYDSINYIPLPEKRRPTLVSKNFTSLVLEDEDRDNIYTGRLNLRAGKKKYAFQLKMASRQAARIKINFNEINDYYPINFFYDHKTKKFSCDYIEKLTELDGKVNSRSLFFNSRDQVYKDQFGAVKKGAKINFKFSARANDLEKVYLVTMQEKIIGNQEETKYLRKKRIKMKKTGFSKDKSREFWQAAVQFSQINVYAYYFIAIDGNAQVKYANNSHVIPVPHTKVIGTGGIGQAYASNDERIVYYRQTVYDPHYKTPDWVQDAVVYYLFPERFKNGNKSNDPRVGVDLFYGDQNIEVHSSWLDSKPWVPGNADQNDTDDQLWCNDFYGGDLAGIIEKLDYLKRLGINLLYLNPIFEAPSNHKYDTADYKKIDHNFGTLAEFKQLIQEAKKRGIKIILDVSLNHSGSDSVYMDRYGKYPGEGAFENEKINKKSPYYDWYELIENADQPDQAYQQWGNPSLANLKESASYKKFAFKARDSVMQYWLSLGIAGWRMDVTPWVSDQFWTEWRRAIKARYPDALTLAETWFDSSKYFLGNTFDSTMNYIFRQAILDFANGQDARQTVAALEMMRENYPPQSFYCLLNLLSTHDAKRALYYYGYKEEGESAKTVQLAKQKLLLSIFFQMTYPGAPAIFYGDEVGVTGADDPFNRAPYTWQEEGGQPDQQLLKEVTRLINLRNNHPVLRRGSLKTIYADQNTIVMLREYQEKRVLVCLNNSPEEKEILLKQGQFEKTGLWHDLMSDEKLQAVQNRLALSLPAYSGRVLIHSGSR